LSLAHRTIGGYNLDEDTPIDRAEIARVETLVRQFYRQDYLMFGY
jgi:hypothetical protein